MRSRDRLWLLLAPLLTLRQAQAQPNTNVPSGSPGREAGGEVQVGAGTQGDVTTGSSGRKSGARTDKSADKSAGDARDSGARSDAPKGRGDRPTVAPAAPGTDASTRPASPR
jgi:hypothetical protein